MSNNEFYWSGEWYWKRVVYSLQQETMTFYSNVVSINTTENRFGLNFISNEPIQIIIHSMHGCNHDGILNNV